MTDTPADQVSTQAEKTAFAVLLAVSFCHMLNDIMQSMLSAIYPMLKSNYGLDFWQIGLLTMAFQVTASLLQPAIGLVTDKRPMPYSLSVGMGSTFVGLLLLATASHYVVLVIGAMFVGLGSAIFHPESSRVARLASGGRYGFAQAVFQVGGNVGSAVGPLLAAFIVMPKGQGSVGWFSFAALLGMLVLWRVGTWYSRYRIRTASRPSVAGSLTLPRGRIAVALAVLITLVIAKNVYMAGISSYYTFFLIEKFGLSVQQSQILLFIFLGSVAAGTVLGGLIGDRIGSKTVIWFSILGVLPFTLALPYADLFWTPVLTIAIGLILASAFPQIVVLAQELLPGRVGMVAGMFFGFAFGAGGLGAAALGILADRHGIEFVYNICSFLPLLGLLTVFLPDLKKTG
ncbi:MFS transporter [Nitratireductor sp. ZSWI3]|uniref:MFS transporter n=1 Tax=Nitratireductor sp. ZSWI3 TaxID=2966359 RepID=UPI00214F698F|nr:MFS transporter [Nitratireductor sp. ZSWI3]MCR4266692.1 MFS transporter [Nitratireductor sp. ZSWI3]